MKDSFQFKANVNLDARGIKAIRKFSNLSIAELKNRALRDAAILDFEIFGSDWQNSRTTISHLLSEIERAQLPLRVFRFNEYADKSIEEQELTVEEARAVLAEIQSTALEQDMHAQLEAGHINAPEEYVPDEDA